MSLNIVFAGTPEFGLPCLEALYQSEYTISAVYTQPDRPAGRGRKLQASAVKQWAQAHDISVYQPINFKSTEALNELANLKPDLMIVIAYGLILPKSVLDIPRFGCINVHASLLPRWRGASPLHQAILNGDSQSGVTIMQMDVGMDTGAMLGKVSCPITSSDTMGSLHDKLSKLAAIPLLNTLNKVVNNEIVAEAQDNSNIAVTYAAKISKEDALLNWQDSAASLDRKIRAFNPWPIAYTYVSGEPLRIHQAQCLEASSAQTPGTIIQLDKNGIQVATGAGILLVSKIQFAGGKAISIADWLNSGKTQLHEGLILQ